MMALSRNANAFSQIPKAEISRSSFDRSSSIKTTFNVGDLIPFYVDEVLPGDTFSIDTSKVIRLQTPTVPFMDNLYLDTYYFFVPNRLVWDHWKEFMGENTESAWIPQTTYQIPQIQTASNPFYCGTVADYMGLPVLKSGALGNALSVSALPFRAYALICNEWFRDENLQNPLLIPTGDATAEPYYFRTPEDGKRWDLHEKAEIDFIRGPATGTTLYKAGKFHDYFTSALPSPQKGADVTIPLVGALLPVVTTNEDIVFPSEGYPRLALKPFDGSAVASPAYSLTANQWLSQDVTTLTGNALSSAPSGGVSLVPTNLGVDVSNATMSSINALRLAFQTQKYFEKLARGGSRYIESIKVNFGVTNPDYRLQRPEYLGGNRLPFNIQQVIQNSAGDSQSTPLGFTGAQSLTTDVHSDFTKSFTEHGFIIGVCVARYHHSYQQNIMRFWSRKDTLDYYFPVFANIGEQPILNKEIYFPTSDNAGEWSEGVFGYQEAWADYRYRPSIVTGEMRSDNPDTLDYWHFADKYTDSTKPALSSSWIQEDKMNVDRALKVQSSIANQIFCDFYIKCKCTRPMPLYSVPGLIDHH